MQDNPAPAPATPATLDPKQAKVTHQWPCPAPLINGRFDPQGRFAIVACEDRNLVRIDLASGQQTPMPGHESWPRGIAFVQQGDVCISSGCDDALIWWETAAAEPKPVRKVTAHRGWVRAVAASPDGTILASGGNDNLVKLWNPADGTQIAELSGHQSHVYSVYFHPQGQCLLSGDLKGQVLQWDLAERKLVRTFDAKKLHTYNGGQQVDYGGVRSLDLSPDFQQLICGGLHEASNPLGAVNQPLVLRYQWESQEELKAHTSDVKGVAWRAMFHPKGFVIAASGGSGGGFLLFWQPDADKPFHQLQLPNTAREMDLHPDRRQILTVHHDRHARITSLTG